MFHFETGDGTLACGAPKSAQGKPSERQCPDCLKATRAFLDSKGMS